jgi:hypothetical protein
MASPMYLYARVWCFPDRSNPFTEVRSPMSGAMTRIRIFVVIERQSKYIYGVQYVYGKYI